MKRETFVALLSALVNAADESLVAEAEQQIAARRRQLRSERASTYDVGQWVHYKNTLGQTEEGAVGKINKYSVTIHKPRPEGSFTPIVVPVERIITPGVRELPF